MPKISKNDYKTDDDNIEDEKEPEDDGEHNDIIEVIKKSKIKDPDHDDDEEDEHGSHTVDDELDEEVLEALNVKKKAKKESDNIDYIPELERDLEEDDF